MPTRKNDPPGLVVTRMGGAPRWIVVLMSITMLAVSFSLWTQGRLSDRTREHEAAQLDRSTVLTECLSRLAVQITTSTAVRSEASERRDNALVASKRALRELIRLRVIEQTANSEQVQQAAEQYMVQTAKFIEASEELDRAREGNPPPEFKDFCPKVKGTEKPKGAHE